MIIKHNDKTPVIHETAWIAPDATICGEVVIGSQSRVLHGARIIAEGGKITIGKYCIIMENAVVRSTTRHSAAIGDHCLIGPNAHVVGSTIQNEVFIATGAAVFHGAILEERSEVRINGVVHLKTRLPKRAAVPIGWVAIGDPAEILPPDEHEKIWKIQHPLNFPLEVYGIDREEALMTKVTKRLSEHLGSHQNDEIIS